MPNVFAEKLAQKGYPVQDARLYAFACDLLHKANRNPYVAHDSFVDALRKDEELKLALIDKMLSEVALTYLREVHADMTGKASISDRGDRLRALSEMQGVNLRLLSESGEKGSDEPSAERSSRGMAPSSPPQGNGERESVEPLAPMAPGVVVAPSLPSQNEGGESITNSAVARPTNAVAPEPSSPNGRGGAQVLFGGNAQRTNGPTTPVHNKPRGLEEELAAKRLTRPSVFDSCKVRDGRAIGDVTYAELGKLIALNRREAELLRLVREHGQPPDPTMRVRDFVKPPELERFIRESREAAHVVA